MKTNKSRLPIHIDRDGLYNAIVVLKVESEYNIRHLLKIVIEKLNEKGSKYNNFDIIANPNPEKKESDKIYIANSEYRIMFSDAEISFNIVSKYRGWQDYKNLIMQIILDLQEKIIVKGLIIRYVSVMEDESVFANMDGTINMNNLPNFSGTEFSFSCNVHDDAVNNAIAKVRLIDKKEIGERVYSFVDITVESGIKDNSMDNLERCLECVHFHEKNLFFLIMSEDYVKSRNPKY